MIYIRPHPQTSTFDMGIEFIRTNKDQDNWFLQIEEFDPHEPFFTHQKYKDLYPHEYKDKHFDWPNYKKKDETAEQTEHVRYEYAALVSMYDESLGRILDLMDELDLWKDTMLIVNTDHGFLLGEHDWWAKCVQPFYNEIAHTPLFIWDPRAGIQGERRSSLVQRIDIAPTVLDFFSVPIPEDMQGKPLKDTVLSDKPIREAGIFGIHGGHVNCTDGRYVYMRAPVSRENQPLYNYTLMPTHMRNRFSINELKTTELAGPFSFTKGGGYFTINTARPVDSLGSFLHMFRINAPAALSNGAVIYDYQQKRILDINYLDPHALTVAREVYLKFANVRIELFTATGLSIARDLPILQEEEQNTRQKGKTVDIFEFEEPITRIVYLAEKEITAKVADYSAERHLKATHVHDNWRLTDSHVVPFNGTINWAPIMRTLTEIGYEGEFTFELGSYNRKKPDIIQTMHARHAYDIGLYLLSLADLEKA